jgi:hypothetical protein
MKKPLFLPVLILCWIALPVYAIRVPGLYEAEVPVPDQLADNRDEAEKSAMRTVLIKITGDRFAPERTSLKPVVDKAGNYIQQYRYVQVPPDKATGEPQQESLHLHVRFDEITLNNTLRDLGIPVWGKERPTTLVWLAVQDRAGRRLVGMEEKPDYIHTLDDRAALRGVVLVYPLLDLEDTSNLRVSDIWGGFNTPVLKASTRYKADTVLVGKIDSPTPGIWEGQWTVYLKGETTTWTSDGELPDIVLDEGVDGLANLLASRFVQSGGTLETATVSIQVRGINNAGQYARAMKYLRSLSPVTDVEVNQVEPGSVLFTVTTHGGEVALQQTITLGRIMEAVNDAGANVYQLLP